MRLLGASILLGAALLTACRDTPIHTIEAHVPFLFTGSVDPRAILTVGDQVVSEHVFAFHARESIKSGFKPLLSKLDFRPDQGAIHITPLHQARMSDGQPIDLETVCRGVEASLKGTHHAPYGALVKKVGCDLAGGRVSITLSAIPLNMRHLFTLPDFSVFSPARMPLTPERLGPTSGPYRIESMSRDRIELKRNPHYPVALVANEIDSAALHSYAAAETHKLIETMQPATHHLAYFYGYALTNEQAGDLERKGYRVEKFPNEWLLFLGFGSKVGSPERELFARLMDEEREDWLRDTAFGIPAYSVSPSDRAFGLSKREYGGSSGAREKAEFSVRRVVTHRSWYELPVFRKICDSLQRKVPGLSVKLVDDYPSLYADGRDVFLSPLGISQSDPLTHMAFLTHTLPEFSRVVSAKDVENASVLDDVAAFDSLIKGFERKIRERRALVPIGHFPGVVAQAPRFERDEELAFGWGIQTWAYRIR